ncbi:hypothetical protein M422DRAFT_248206 [Sphaerobolus stellatus SS14]|uniref:BTB domain-containing protein n=1 Tax=Sphaerobolus stellatus (strain SS14) TaxID=990650 RepID=A0A0C9VJ85_SPHS4|nr:hypothetical protein M422DRAFT_248206 [Sphaerobolus stellatus SS14]
MIILLVIDTVFRVNADLLERRSEVFATMLSLPKGSSQDEMVDDYPVVRLQDKKADWEEFLEVFYGERVGTVASGFMQINSQPKLPVISVPVAQQPNEHWTSQVDVIIGPDGQKMNLVSSVAGTPNGHWSRCATHGVKHDIQWNPRCKLRSDARLLNDAVRAGGQPDVHNRRPELPYPSIRYWACVILPRRRWRQIVCWSFPTHLNLQRRFLRHDHGHRLPPQRLHVINFGDFVDSNPGKQGQAFMQLLPTTTATIAHQQFVKSCLSGIDTTGSQPRPHVPSDFSSVTTPTSSPSVASKDFSTAKSFIQKNWIYFAALIIGTCIFSSVRRRRRTSLRNAYPSAVFATDAAGSYKQLHNPTPDAAMDEHGMAGMYGGFGGMQASRVIHRGRRSRITLWEGTERVDREYFPH